MQVDYKFLNKSFTFEKTNLMSGLNKVILIGNVGRDPEMRYSEGNIGRLSFSMATTEYYKDRNGNRTEHTEWHNIVMWRGLAENAEKIIKKGSQVYIEGKIQSRQWNDKDGNKKNVTEIVAENFILLQRGGNGVNEEKLGTGQLPS
jgi:single-strand DNA-binding protein